MNCSLQNKLRSFEAYAIQPDGLWHAYCYDIVFDAFTVVKFEPSGKQVDLEDGLEFEKVKYIWEASQKSSQ